MTECKIHMSGLLTMGIKDDDRFESCTSFGDRFYFDGFIFTSLTVYIQ